MTTETATRPAALANLKDKVQGPPSEPSSSYCGLHGLQLGNTCPLCDEHYPDAVKAREVAGPTTVPTADVQALVDAAVKKAIAEQVAFQTWKTSSEGQAAAAAAATANVTPPDHATPAPDEKPPSNTVPPAPTNPQVP